MSTATQEHEILTYVRAQERMDLIVEGTTPMIMKMKTPLAKALDAMTCIPFVQNSYKIWEDRRHTLTIAGVEAGTLYNPKVDVILEKSIPSSFGKNSGTVLDPSYRSGQEIRGEDIGFDGYIAEKVLDDVKGFMFPGRKVDAKLYKLAVYEDGGHFDWHRDSTHSDKHHATLLLALNTSWEGGDLVFRRNGIETHVDLRPRSPTPNWIELQAVVFFTDTEHRVEPVKSGIRIVLQFDIELEKAQEGEDEGKENQDENEEETEYDSEEKTENYLDPLWAHYSKRMKTGADAQATADKATIEKVLAIIKELHNNGTEEVAFALQHLYRDSSILGEYLKGSDATLYEALKVSGEFDVSLHPVIFREASGWDSEGAITDHYVYRCDEVTESDESDGPPPSKKKKRNRSTFHIPELSGIQEISRQDYVDYTGNEALPAEYRYFGGGMFIRPKGECSTK